MANFSQTLLTVLVASAILSCQSTSTVKSRKLRHPAIAEKVTQDSAMGDQVELGVETVYSPRRFSELESAVMLNPDIQNCLRSALESHPLDISVGIEGRISYTGDTENVVAETESKGLKTCLEIHIAALKHGRGIQGPFKMLIHRQRQPASAGKGLILDLKPMKKFE